AKHFGCCAAPEISCGLCDSKSSDGTIKGGKRRLNSPACGDRVFIIRALHRVIDKSEITNIAGKRAKMIEARDERECPRTRQPPVSGFKPEHAAERGRDPDRTVGIRTESNWDDPCASGRARTA